MDISPEGKPSAGKISSTLSSYTTGGGGTAAGPMQSWWEGVAKARERINALKDIVGPLSSLENLQESERPARGLLEDEQVAHAILSHFASPSSGHGHDALCQWLYDTFQTGDPDLQAVVLRYIPALCGLYLPRIVIRNDESLAGLEAVLLALYSAEAKSRQGCPMVVNIPDLSQSSLYHAPRIPSASPSELRLGQLSAALEPQDTVKATKRACIVSVALDLFCRKIAVMPRKAKIEACQCAQRLARLSCSQEAFSNPSDDEDATLDNSSIERSLDSNLKPESVSLSEHMPEIEIVGPGELFLGNKSPSHYNAAQNQAMVFEPSFSPKCPPSMKRMSSDLPPPQTPNAVDLAIALIQAGNGARIPLPWELIQPLIRILGHCLLAPSKNSEDVKEAASAAVKVLYRRAFHDLIPEAMLATRSLMRLERASKQITKTSSASGNSTGGSSKSRKPEMLLVSK